MSEGPVKLIPLVCIQCGQPIVAQPGEVCWVCSTCGKGNLLGGDGVLKAQTVFFSPQLQSEVKGKPFWVTQGQVAITKRDTYQGNSSREAAEFWAKPRLFFIPAFAAPLETLVSTGMALLKNPVYIQQAGSPCDFVGVTSGLEDIRPLAEFIVLAIEAERRDALKVLNFDLKLQPPQLWILP